LNLAHLFQRYDSPPELHSFPTRRSSDLGCETGHKKEGKNMVQTASLFNQLLHHFPRIEFGALVKETKAERHARGFTCWAQFVSRSEEHTSELQSRFDLVCRLLLEKKK